MKMRLAEIRKAHGLTQADVGNHIGVSSNYYARLERGDASVRQIHLEALASFYNCAPSELFEIANVPPRLQRAIDHLRNHFSGMDLSQDVSEICLLIGGMDSTQVAKLKEHARLLAAYKRG